MKAKKQFLLVCENAVKDASGKQSFINLFDSLGGPTIPIIAPSMYIVFSVLIRLESLNENLSAKISIKSPSGQELIAGGATMPLNKQITLDEQEVGGQIYLQNPVFIETGLHKITLTINDKKIADRTLAVIHGEMPNAETNP